MPLAATLLIAAVTLGLLEAGARTAYEFREELRYLPLESDLLRRTLILDPYEMPSSRGGAHWVLRPGYTVSATGLLADKKASGRAAGAEAIEKGLAESVNPAAGGLRINAKGFRGPEIDPAHSRPRILILGDSVTFGTGAFSYPQAVAAALNAAGPEVEVINGGVEGYSWSNIYFELDRYQALEPEIVTLFAGWNTLFFDAPPTGGFEDRLRTIWLAGKILRALTADPQENALRIYNRNLVPDRHGKDVRALDGYSPPFLERIEKVVDAFRSLGSRVVLVTLPGLFVMEEDPTPEALKVGHLPEFTNNPFVLAGMTAAYNDALRAIAARRGLPVIDLERWSLEKFRPRSAFFSDSVHLTPKGMEMVGFYFAERLRGMVAELQNR